MMNRKVIIICGPTAVGKTKYSIEIAKAFDGEIVSADSMQIYKYLDIGSAKPTEQELTMIPHHMVDQVDPSQSFSVAAYQKMAKEAIEDIFSRGKTPVITGGTGLYVHSLIYDMDFAKPPVSSSYRLELEEMAKKEGNQAVHDLLKSKDQKAAEQIHPNSLKRVIRALEILELGVEVKPFEKSFVPTKDYDYTLIGLSRDRDELYERINRRVDLLMEMGLEREIRQLLAMGLTENNISMKGIGYKELIDYINGATDLEYAVDLVKKNSRHYAKRQMTWFRRYPDIHWFHLSDHVKDEESIEEILEWLRTNK